MDARESILAEAARLFDLAGIATYDGRSLIICAVVSSPKRDLDIFILHEDGSSTADGFEAHMVPRLEALIGFIQGLGIRARMRGRKGYSLDEAMGLKRRAVAAGLATWGKNGVLVHPKYGPWLRLGVVDLPETHLEATGPDHEDHIPNPLCQDCDLCIGACPDNLLVPYGITDRWACRADFAQWETAGRGDVCNRCLDACPVGRA
jgi:epoxyqueuosine reductase QueG